MAKQTAVQFLVMRYHQWQGILKDRDIEEAKAMEKEHIIKAHGLKYYDLNEEVITGEQYYKDTYENNK